MLERADDVWREHRAWGGVKDIVPEPPSTYYYKHVYGCFFKDRHGLESLDRVGVDNVTFETDYPHTDSTWPDTLEIARDLDGRPPRRRRLQDPARQRDPHAVARHRLNDIDAQRRTTAPSGSAAPAFGTVSEIR